MKYLTLRITSDQSRLLGEAWRRLDLGTKKDVTDKFLGLGTPSEYKPAVTAGLMKPSFGEISRVWNWYCLTPIGQAIIKQMVRKYGRVDNFTHPIVPPCGNYCKVKIKLSS